MDFQPNRLKFEQGVKRVTDAMNARGASGWKHIVTSKDKIAQELLRDLNISNIPGGFTKVQLPIIIEKPSQLYMSFGAPNTEVPLHSHDEGDGVRIIMWGSIIYEGTELSAGDWMFIPAGQKYRFSVGARGVGICYCYSCCCA